MTVNGSRSNPAAGFRLLPVDNAHDALQNFDDALSKYDSYFGRTLGPEEIDDALEQIVVMQAASVSLLKSWQNAVPQADHSNTLKVQAEQATDLMADGALLLRSLRPAGTFALHLHSQCKRNSSSLLIDERKTDAAAEASETLDVIASSIERDISLLVGRVSVLLMEQQSEAINAQMALGIKVSRLTTVTTWLTFIILMGTLFGGAVGAYATFR